MSIVYQSDLAIVHHGDARDVLATIETETIDLVVADPPYGAEWQSARRLEQFAMLDGDGAGAEDREGVRSILTECVRVVGQHRHLYVFGPSDVLDGLKVTAPAVLVWDKGTPGLGDLAMPWAPAHEPINFAVSKYRHGGEAGRENQAVRMRKGSVLRHTRPTGRKVRHPSEKPVPLLRELIESSSRAGDVVLDPCAGIGSTGVAAILLHRRVVLCETDERYVPTMVERVRAAEQIVEDSRWL